MRYPIGTKVFIGNGENPLGVLTLTEHGLEAISDINQAQFDDYIRFLHSLYPGDNNQDFILRLGMTSSYHHWTIIAKPPYAETTHIEDVTPKTLIISQETLVLNGVVQL